MLEKIYAVFCLVAGLGLSLYGLTGLIKKRIPRNYLEGSVDKSAVTSALLCTLLSIMGFFLTFAVLFLLVVNS